MSIKKKLGRPPKLNSEEKTVTRRGRTRKNRDNMMSISVKKKIEFNPTCEDETLIVELPIKKNENKKKENIEDEEFSPIPFSEKLNMEVSFKSNKKLNVNENVNSRFEEQLESRKKENTKLSYDSNRVLQGYNEIPLPKEPISTPTIPEPEETNKYKIVNYCHNTKKTNVKIFRKLKNVVIHSDLFDNPDKWVENTDYYCWWCCHPFDGPPIPIPSKYDKLKKKFHVYGCFCSFNCAKSYVLNKPLLKFSTNDLLGYMYRIIFDKKMEIKNAPPKEILKVFGGDKSIEEYRQTFNDFKEYHIISLPVIPCVFQYTEESKDIIKFDLKTSEQSKSEPEPLRLKRNKPLKNSKCTLDNLFNFN